MLYFIQCETSQQKPYGWKNLDHMEKEILSNTMKTFCWKISIVLVGSW
jgi:hypothetical protein